MGNELLTSVTEGQTCRRRAIIVLTVFAITFPVVLFTSSKTAERFRNEITEWADPSAEPTEEFRRYREWFGTNEFVLLTWPGCTRESEVLDSLRERLRTDDRINGLVESVTSGRSVFHGLTTAGRLDDDVATERLVGSILGPDGQTTGLAFNLSETGRYQRGAVFRILNEILKDEGIDPATVHFAGLGHDLHVLDDEGFHSPFRMVPLIMLSALLLTWLFVRDVWLACFINALGTYTGAMAFVLIFFSSINLNAIVWPLPTLLLLLTVSASLHFLGYYRNALSRTAFDGNAAGNSNGEHVSHFRVVQQALRHATKPIVCCSLTTAVGLLSLCLSSTRPVRQFGFFGSLAVLVACAVLLLSLPAWLVVFPPRFARQLSAKNLPTESRFVFGLGSNFRFSSGDAVWGWLAVATNRYRWPIIVVMIGGMLVLGSGIPGIRTGGNLENFFPAGHAVLADAAAIENDIGPLSSIDLLLRFDKPVRGNDFKRIENIRQLTRSIQSSSAINATLSAATFSPEWQGGDTGLSRAAKAVRLKQLRGLLVDYKLLFHQQQHNFEVWRVSLRYSGLDETDVPTLVQNARQSAIKTFAPNGDCIFADESFEPIVTGEFVLFDHVDRQFLTDLTVTYSTAFVLISVVVLLLLRSFGMMLLTSFPNLFPALIVLGTGGWLSQSLDVASLMTASVALGIAVDDTLHFVLWYRERLQAGDSPTVAIEDAMRHCGAAMIQTSVTCGLSILLYAFCGFLPTVRFGVLLCTMLLMALVGDLILLPALLALKQKRS